MGGKTLYDKIWEAHWVGKRADGMSLMYVDRHLLHEVTSPQAFEGLRLAGRAPWRVGANLATPDHNVPTVYRERATGVEGIADEVARIQVQTLDDNCRDFGIEEFGINDVRQGIVHVIGPGAGRDAAGHDHRLRRFAYFDARRLRCAGAGYRHIRGRARPGDRSAWLSARAATCASISKASCRPECTRRI